MTDPTIGTVVSGYRIVGRLGEGGMGVVYEGLEPEIGKRVAIKVVLPELAADLAFMTRLLDEARAVNAIRHRGIVDIFGAGTLLDGRKCILMEYLEGGTLDGEIRQAAQANRTMPLMRVLTICDEVLNALDAAHLANIVHRDLKPSNIFLCRQPNGERHVKLLDFGIAKVAAGGSTHSSGVVGTPLYMAPEQAIADRLTSAVDLYAFGVILFELLTGRVPFSGESVARVMFHHLHTPPPLPSESSPSIPAALDRLVSALLAKDPAQRPTASAARSELARVRVALSDPTALPTLDEPRDRPHPNTLAFASGVAPAVARPPANLVEATIPLGDTVRSVTATSAEVARLALDSKPPPNLEPAVSASPRRALTRLALAVVVLLVALGGWYLSRSSPREEGPVSPPPVAPPPTTPPVETTTPRVEEPPVAIAKPELTEQPPVRQPKRAVTKPAAVVKPVEARLARLEATIHAAKARGEDMELAERQLRQLRTGFATAKSQHEREAFEVALTRLEAELEE